MRKEEMKNKKQDVGCHFVKGGGGGLLMNAEESTRKERVNSEEVGQKRMLLV